MNSISGFIRSVERRLRPAVIVAAASGCGIAHAATITVHTTGDTLDDTDGLCSLREAIDNANADDQSGSAECVSGSGDDTIVFDGVLAGGTIMLSGSELPTITAAVTIEGPVAGDPSGLVLDGNDSSRILHVQGSAPRAFDVELIDMTLTRGRTTAPADGGGAIRISNANLLLTGVHVTDSTTEGNGASGGGVAVIDGEFEMTHGSAVSGNATTATTSGSGGGVSVQGDFVTVESTIADNATSGDFANGGGLNVSGNAIVVRSTVADNATSGDSAVGGGLRVNGGDLVAVGSTISGNSTTGPGAVGGGLSVAGNARLTNSTVSGNSTAGASAGAGGLRVGGDATLENTTIAFNTAADGVDGVDAAGGTFTLENTLVVQEFAGEQACAGPADTVTASLATDTSCAATATDFADIALVSLLNFNGGVTRTHALDDSSVAIASGDNVSCKDADQRGAPRLNDPDCDIGAYEAGVELDLGDAPGVAAGDYPVLLLFNGAAHGVGAGGPILGALVDAEDDGQPSTAADLDDGTDSDDEDGIFFASAIAAGGNASVDVTVTGGAAILNAWVDFNADGDWDDTGEQVFTDESLVDGSNTGLSFAVPEDAVIGDSIARFRLSSAGGLAPTGIAVDGEVEDYSLTIEAASGGGAGGTGGSGSGSGSGGGSGGGGGVAWPLLVGLLIAAAAMRRPHPVRGRGRPGAITMDR